MRFLKQGDWNQKRLLLVKVALKYVSLTDCYAMQNETLGTSLLEDPTDRVCVACHTPLNEYDYVRCCDCHKDGVEDVILCPACFSLGVEIGDHKRGHNYQVDGARGPSVFRSDNPNWGFNVDLDMLSAFQAYQTERWEPQGVDLKGVDPVEVTYQRLDECFLRGSIGRYILRNKSFPVLKEVDPTVAKEASDEKRNYIDGYALAESIAVHPEGNFLVEDTISGIKSILCLDNSGRATKDNSTAVVSWLSRWNRNNPEAVSGRSDADGNGSDGIVGNSFGQTPRKYSIAFTEDNESEPDGKARLKAAKEEVLEDGTDRAVSSPTRAALADGALPDDARNGRHSVHSASPRRRESGSGVPSPERLMLKIKIKREEGTPRQSQTTPVMSPTDERMRLRSKRSLTTSTPDPLSPRSSQCQFPPMSPSFSGRRDLTSPTASGHRTELVSPSGRAYTTRSRTHSDATHPPRTPKVKSEPMNEFVTRERSRSPNDDRDHSLEQSKTAESAMLPDGHLTAEEVNRLRIEYPHPFFFENRVPPLPDEAIERLSKEDLNVIAYMPKRDDFEHEDLNSAERLLSTVLMRPEPEGELTDSAKFMREVKLARMRCYNRMLEQRIARHGAIREYEMLDEFFSYQKNGGVDEPVRPFPEGTFPKRKEEEYRPLFCAMRQVATKEELESLAQKLGKMEALKEDIRKLQELQRNGETEIKGRLMSDSVRTSTKRKKKGKQRFTNPQNRKSKLKWQHIVRYNKKMVNQASAEPDDDE